MPITFEQYNSVQLYLDGEMTETQQKEFLSHLREDEELRESLEFEKFLRRNAHSIRQTDEIIALSRQEPDIIADAGRTAAVRALIETAGQEWRQEQGLSEAPLKTAPVKVIPIKRTAWIAAAACLLLITGSLVLYLSTHSGGANAANGELFAQSFNIEKVPEGNYPLLNQALKAYNNKDYTAIQTYPLDEMPTSRGAGDEHDKMQGIGYYYRGISYLATNDPNKAITSLQWVIDHHPSEELVWKAQWYKALAFVKLSRTAEAISLLHTVASNPAAGDYIRQANTLLTKLEGHAH